MHDPPQPHQTSSVLFTVIWLLLHFDQRYAWRIKGIEKPMMCSGGSMLFEARIFPSISPWDRKSFLRYWRWQKNVIALSPFQRRPAIRTCSNPKVVVCCALCSGNSWLSQEYRLVTFVFLRRCIHPFGNNVCFSSRCFHSGETILELLIVSTFSILSIRCSSSLVRKN